MEESSAVYSLEGCLGYIVPLLVTLRVEAGELLHQAGLLQVLDEVSLVVLSEGTSVG